LTPPTQTHRQAATGTGFLTTTAPRGPTQPARHTPSAQTAALAVRDSKVMVTEKASRAAPASSNERMLFLPWMVVAGNVLRIETCIFLRIRLLASRRRTRCIAVFAPLSVDCFLLQGEPMAEFTTRWTTFYAEKVEPFYKELVSHIEKLIIGTLIVSAGAHVSSDQPSIQLFGYLRHSLVGRGVMLIGVVILALNFIDGLYKLAKVNRHTAWQIVMSLFYIAVSVRLIQLILAFRGGE